MKVRIFVVSMLCRDSGSVIEKKVLRGVVCSVVVVFIGVFLIDLNVVCSGCIMNGSEYRMDVKSSLLKENVKFELVSLNYRLLSGDVGLSSSSR